MLTLLIFITLIAALKQVKDCRTKRGQRYPLWVILLLAVLVTLNGCPSNQALVDHLQLALKRLPSARTVRR